MMGYATVLERINGAKTSHRCSWCAERIDVGSSYLRYRYYSDGDAGTVKLHPECSDILDVTVREEGGDYEFHAGENPRGCNCGHERGCLTCAEVKANLERAQAALPAQGHDKGGEDAD